MQFGGCRFLFSAVVICTMVKKNLVSRFRCKLFCMIYCLQLCVFEFFLGFGKIVSCFDSFVHMGNTTVFTIITSKIYLI